MGFLLTHRYTWFSIILFFALSQSEAPEIYSKVRTLLLNLLHFSRGIMRLKVKAVNAILLSYTHFFFQMMMTNAYISTHSQESFMSRLAVKKENASGERKQIRILNICIHIYVTYLCIYISHKSNTCEITDIQFVDYKNQHNKSLFATM